MQSRYADLIRARVTPDGKSYPISVVSVHIRKGRVPIMVRFEALEGRKVRTTRDSADTTVIPQYKTRDRTVLK